MKRYIRLKELGINLHRVYKPSDKYLIDNEKLNPDESYLVKTDCQGMQLSVVNNTSSNTIFLLGGSSVESLYLKASDRPQSLLEYSLLASGFDYSVKNLGVSGSQSLNLINVIINKLGNKQGSTIIFTVPSNDLSTLALSKTYWNNHKHFSSIVPNDINYVEDRPIYDLRNVNVFERNLRLIKAICSELGLHLIFTTILYRNENKSLAKLNQVLRSFCSENNIDLIDMESDFLNSELFYDNLHFLSGGSKLYSKKIYEFLVKKDLAKGVFLVEKQIAYCFELGSEAVWSEAINVNGLKKLSLIIDFEDYPTLDKAGLYAVQYGKLGNYSGNGLHLSPNSNIGWYKYFDSGVHKEIEMFYDIYIPENAETIKVGLLAWAQKKGIRIKKAYLQAVYQE